MSTISVSTTSTISTSATDTYVIENGGSLVVSSGGSVTNTVVQNGGTLTVSSGGSATSGTISAGAVEQVFSGGVTSGDTIYGTVSGANSGPANFKNETVMGGGVLSLTTSNVASGITVDSGGSFILNGNISATNTVLSGGGMISLASPKATVLGSLTFKGGSNTLSVTSVVTTSSGTYGEVATISGFSSTDKIDVTVFGPAATLSFTSSGGNEVATISTSAGKETFTFSGTSTYNAGTLDVVGTNVGTEDIEYFASGVTSVTTSTVSGTYAVSSGSEVIVASGGSITGATVGSGGVLQVRGGNDTSATISTGALETVWSGSASNDTVYGTLATLSGGTATLTSETVGSGGRLVVQNGDSASATTVLSGGTMVLSGATGAVTNTVLSAGGNLILTSPKATISGGLAFVGGGNTLIVSALASSGYGDLAAISGFSSADEIDVTLFGAGATLSFTTSSGNEIVTINGTSAGSSVSESFIFSGSTAYTSSTLAVVANGGKEFIEYNSNGWPTGTISALNSGSYSSLGVSSSETLSVLSGASVTSTTVAAGGTLVISGGSDIAANVLSGGAETVLSGSASGDMISGTLKANGGTITSDTILAGGNLNISGGSAQSITVSSGATESINSGSASNDLIYGSATVGSGGHASSETIENGATMTVLSGATVSGTIILSGGQEIVSAGSASGEFIYGTISTISKGTGVFTSETVENGGTLMIANGNSATGTMVLSGGTLLLSGNNGAVTNTTLSGGGTLVLDSPKANVSGTLTFAGGGNTLDVADFASAGYGDLTPISGFSTTDAIDVTIFGAGATLAFGSSGGNEIVTISSTSGSESFIFSGSSTYTGSTVGLISSGGHEYIEYNPQGFTGITTSVTTSTAAGIYSEPATDTLLVLSGGSVTSAAINNAAFLIVNGGTDTGATISAGGLETVSAGSATSDILFGSAEIFGGSVTKETALSDGVISVESGASVTNTALTSGGTLDLAAATAVAAGSITLSGGGNTIEASAISTTGFGDQAVISGFTSSDKIDVTGISSTGARLSFATNNNGNQIATISGTGGSESFIFSDPTLYNSGTMSLASDGNGVDLVLDTTPVIQFTSLGGFSNQPKTIVNGTVDIATDPEAIGQTVSVFEGNTVVGTAKVGSDGYWNAVITFPIDVGTNVLTASITDKAGNTGTTSQSLTYNVNTTAAAFTAGNLVISISGDGDGSGTYGDNQGSPMVLEQVTTSGTYVSQIVMPQTTTVVNGVTEYAISSEYGSSSEGTLELSADGHSLVIAGYGVNADTYNAGGAAVYGNAALAQTTSVQGGQYTAVARVIADINADGTIDTSTALYDVFNTQNPRSVATVDGTSFWIAGQGVKGSTNQGVFYALDGASSATAIDTASDTRTAMIYNGQLYVSADSTQVGGAQIQSYGGLPTSATTPTLLTGIGTSVTLSATNGNSVNGGNQTVYLSPENYFFANSTTLYVADGGTPKEGGVGDGGLQKWSLVNGTWQLDYTMSAGLNLVSNTSSSGSTGLIGLTGQVVGANVELYATNELVTDIGATGVYAITDQLSATSAQQNETFTEIYAASADENIRGIALAPTGYTPTITGTVAGQTTGNNGVVQPFASAVVADENSTSNPNIVDTLTITLSGGAGTLSGTGLVANNDGTYTLSGSASAVTSALQTLSFEPNALPNSTSTTKFSLVDTSSAVTTTASDATTTVIDTDAAVAPTITGTIAKQTTTSEAMVKPFSGVTIGDVNANATDTLTITLSGSGGTLSGTGLVANGNGTYTLSGAATTVTSELQALSFTATAGQANTTSTTSFTLSDKSSAFATPSIDTTTSVIDIDPSVAVSNSGNAEDGYLVGATVGYLNVSVYQSTGQITIDTSQPTTTTGANGLYTLAAYTGVGGPPPVVLQGGTDSTTGLTFAGTIEAPNGSSVISPLTTLVYQIAQAKGDTSMGGIAAANASLVSALGLASGTNLTTLDAQAGTVAGNSASTQVFLAENEVASLATLIQSAGNVSNAAALYSAIATTIAGGGNVDLTSASSVSSLATDAGVSSSAASAIGSIVSSTATALNNALASSTSTQSTFDSIVGESIALQQTAADSIANAAVSSNPNAAYASAATTYTQSVDTTLSTATASASDQNSGLGWGDVHMVTFQGLHYDFMAVGDYTLEKSALAGDTFDVQIRTSAWSDMVSVTTEIGAQVGANAVQFDLNGTVKLNGAVDTALSSANSVQAIDGGTITRTADSYVVNWSTGESLTVTNDGAYLNESVTLGAKDSAGSVAGLLGTNTSQATDIQLADGTVLQDQSTSDLMGAYAESWQVASGSSLLNDNAGLALGFTNGGNTATPFNGKSSIDLANFSAANATLGFSEDASGSFGTLTISNGVQQTALILMGQYAAGSFGVASDGHGGTAVDYTPPKTALLG